MEAQHPSSSGNKNTTVPIQAAATFTPPRPLLATALIGAALIVYLVHKSAGAREHLQSLTRQAMAQGELTERDAKTIADLLDNPIIKSPRQGEPRYVF